MVSIRNYSACFMLYFSIYKKPGSLLLPNEFLSCGVILYSKDKEKVGKNKRTVESFIYQGEFPTSHFKCLTTLNFTEKF